MKHVFRAEEWELYLTDPNALKTRAMFDAHLVNCKQCWELYQQESPAMRALSEAGQEARRELTIDEPKLRIMFSHMMTNLGAEKSELNVTAQIQRSLEFLKSVLHPVFGSKATQRALQLAAHGSSGRSLDRMTVEGWNAFLDQLTAIVSIICGDVFASLIREHGKLLAAEE